MAEEKHQNKWEGKSSVEMKGATADQVWPFLADFYNFHKWLPGIDTCCRVDAEPGDMIRYCSSTMVLDGGETKVNWAKEKVTEIDAENRCLSYEVVGSNLGFGWYEGTIKVMHVDGDGCKMEWSFVCDPIQGWSFQDLCSYIDFSLEGMAKRMEDAVVSSQ